MISTVRIAKNGDWRRLTVIWKLAISWVVVELSEHFTVRAPKWRSDDKLSKASGKRWFLDVSQQFCKVVSFLVQMGLGESFTVKAPQCRSDDKQSETN